MPRIATSLLLGIAFLILLGVTAVSGPAAAQQLETSVMCDEGVIPEPIDFAYGEHTTNCAISPATDSDLFDFVGTAGDVVRFILDGLNDNYDPFIRVIDPMGMEIANESCDGNSNSCSVISDDIVLPETGTYRIIVADAGANETGNYTLQIERIPPVLDPPGLDYGGVAPDAISPTTDMDFLNFQAEAGDLIEFAVLGISDNYDPRLEIWDPDGTKVHDQACDGNSNGCSFLVALTPALSGTYLLAMSDSGANESGSYQVGLTCVFGTCPEVRQPPLCELELDMGSYMVGDTVTANLFRLAYPGPGDNVSVELWAYTEGEALGPVSLIKTEPIGLSASFDVDFGPRPLFTIPAAFAPGTYEVHCRLIDGRTARLVAEDVANFEVVE